MAWLDLASKAWKSWTGNDDADEHRRQHENKDRFSADPGRHAQAKEEVRTPKAEGQTKEDHEYRSSVNDNVVKESSHRHHGYQDAAEPESLAGTLTTAVALGALGVAALSVYKLMKGGEDEDEPRRRVNVVPKSSVVPDRFDNLSLQTRRAKEQGLPVVPDRFDNLSLTEQLKMYHNKKLKLDVEQTKRAKELVKIYIGGIVDNVREQIDAGRPPRANRCRIEYTGSMYEGTKFGQPDEFDIMIVIDGSQEVNSKEMTPGYARLRTGPFSDRFSRFLDPHQRQSISPKKMVDWFTGLVQKGVNKASVSVWDPVSLTVSRHGPAVMVNIEERNGLSIDVDLVLCVQLSQERYYVAKPYKPYADEPPPWSLACDPAVLWRQSFSVTETRMIARIDGANECRRDCLRILKSIFRMEPGLDKFTSFHLKTVLLRMCQDEEQWPSSKMGERFLDLLRRIESCLYDEYLPHFYLPELNLLDGIRHETIENMRRRVRRLINSESERNTILYVR
ncbi:cyclic GMP-AMP synthase-like receptor 3 [Branchiostoma lanceolatum]|uniref:cyclic GMP-AMP synthase-like receptor 3 n=1 Tax=Branchiostoma lanceolatum TaxID=7740 RepID=UPI003453FD4A